MTFPTIKNKKVYNENKAEKKNPYLVDTISFSPRVTELITYLFYIYWRRGISEWGDISSCASSSLLLEKSWERV